MIATGNARGVHHIESPAMISLARMCNVRDIDCLIAIVSVIRPGAANGTKKTQFARRAQGLEPVDYVHPSLERALRSTFGVVAYEEHILQICEAFAGLPAGRADILRRALVKMKTATIEEIGREFITAARALDRTDAEIARVWELVTGFQGYAFCRAHSTAYGVEAYQGAWLKRYHPATFLACVLSNGKGLRKGGEGRITRADSQRSRPRGLGQPPADQYTAFGSRCFSGPQRRRRSSHRSSEQAPPAIRSPSVAAHSPTAAADPASAGCRDPRCRLP